MPEMVANMNATIPEEPKVINLHLDGFDIFFDYDFFSNEFFVSLCLI